MKQASRELSNCEDGFLTGQRYVIMDRDSKFCESFRDILDADGIEPLLLPPRSPNLNSHLERFFGILPSVAVDQTQLVELAGGNERYWDYVSRLLQLPITDRACE